ncbi:MAG: AAC(3) family N-acetyltransferase [Faecalibacterium prausnitzii]|nr:AAC(3) family N-acetyltransferase [Faecalibacterium prausnitzii]MDY2681712.1 AAC(3) family N-acetyltransferase [Faecalibacterium prausnitzii]
MAHTKETLRQDLVAMGLTGTETILIHSSMKSIGEVEGGADTVLDVLMEFFAGGAAAAAHPHMAVRGRQRQGV